MLSIGFRYSLTSIPPSFFASSLSSTFTLSLLSLSHTNTFLFSFPLFNLLAYTFLWVSVSFLVHTLSCFLSDVVSLSALLMNRVCNIYVNKTRLTGFFFPIKMTERSGDKGALSFVLRRCSKLVRHLLSLRPSK